MTAMPRSLDEIRAVMRAHQARWLAMEDVVAVGIGRLADDRDGILVSVRSDAEAFRDRLPRSIDGVPLEVRGVGDIRAL